MRGFSDSLGFCMHWDRLFVSLRTPRAIAVKTNQPQPKMVWRLKVSHVGSGHLCQVNSGLTAYTLLPHL